MEGTQKRERRLSTRRQLDGAAGEISSALTPARSTGGQSVPSAVAEPEPIVNSTAHPIAGVVCIQQPPLPTSTRVSADKKVIPDELVSVEPKGPVDTGRVLADKMVLQKSLQSVRAAHRAWDGYKIELQLIIDGAKDHDMVAKNLYKKLTSIKSAADAIDAQLLTLDKSVRAGLQLDMTAAKASVDSMSQTIKQAKDTAMKVSLVMKADAEVAQTE